VPEACLTPQGRRPSSRNPAQMLRSALLAVLLLVPLCSGCVAAAAAGLVGAGIVQYHRNEVQQDFPNDLSESWQGSFEGLAHLGIEPTESELGPTEGRIVFGDLVILIERHPEGFTRVRVRAGCFRTDDHMRRAQIVLQEIGAALERQDELRAWADKVQGLPERKPDGNDGSKPKP
jgi:hypothetical protein